MIDTPTITALGWTLIHSIWQLSLLALIFYTIMISWRTQNPVQRYRISLLFMLISLSMTCLTFIVMYGKFSALSPLDVPTAVNAWPITPGVNEIGPGGWWESFIVFLQTNVTSMTYLYMLGVALLMGRMGLNFWSLQRLTSRATPIDTGQLNFLQDLMEKMTFRKNVSVRSSDQVRIPMVIGAFQPVILIPLSILSNTPPHLLKAMMAHELAHVERYDFAINLIQSIVETLFFYHPAVWYFSYMARREREYCCDQRAVELGCAREDLVRALTEVGELQQNQTLSMSLGGQSNELLNRVKCLVGLQPSHRYVPDHSIWYYGSLLGVLLLLSIGKHQFFANETFPEESSISVEYVDTLPAPDQDEKKNLMVIKRADSMVVVQKDRGTGETLIRTDTMIRTYRSDTLPSPPGSMTIISDDNGKITVNGKEIDGMDEEAMRKLQDSLLSLDFRLGNILPDQHQLDSMIARVTAQFNRDARRNRWPDMSAFEFHFPDTIPLPSFNLDSMWRNTSFQNMMAGGGLDSAFQQMWKEPFVFSKDSMMVYFQKPYFNPERLEEIQDRSREWKENQREHREKYRQQMEQGKLQREKYLEHQKKYRQQMEQGRMQQEKYREQLKKFREQQEKYRELQEKYQELQEKYQELEKG